MLAPCIARAPGMMVRGRTEELGSSVVRCTGREATSGAEGPGNLAVRCTGYEAMAGAEGSRGAAYKAEMCHSGPGGSAQYRGLAWCGGRVGHWVVERGTGAVNMLEEDIHFGAPQAQHCRVRVKYD